MGKKKNKLQPRIRRPVGLSIRFDGEMKSLQICVYTWLFSLLCTAAINTTL